MHNDQIQVYTREYIIVLLTFHIPYVIFCFECDKQASSELYSCQLFCRNFRTLLDVPYLLFQVQSTRSHMTYPRVQSVAVLEE